MRQHSNSIMPWAQIQGKLGSLLVLFGVLKLTLAHFCWFSNHVVLPHLHVLGGSVYDCVRMLPGIAWRRISLHHGGEGRAKAGFIGHNRKLQSLREVGTGLLNCVHTQMAF